MQLPAEGNYILGPDVFVVGAAKHAWKPHSWAVPQEWINNEQSHKMLVSIYQIECHSPFSPFLSLSKQGSCQHPANYLPAWQEKPLSE